MTSTSPDLASESSHRKISRVPGFWSSSGSIRYVPGLDGLRAIFVLIVVAFHAELALFQGGYLGVSGFFTLSGFLVGMLALAETDATGTFALRPFWTRRIQRLLPSTLATLALVTLLFVPFVASTSQLDGLRAELISSVLYLTNWQFIASGSSYGDLFSDPSPVLHFWSLGIEVQFYIILPPLIAAAMLWRKGGIRAAWALVGGLAALSVLVTFVFNRSIDRVYFGTDTRLFELLTGVALALLVSNLKFRQWLVQRNIRMLVTLVGLFVLGVQAYMWTAVPQSSAWLYSGGLVLYGLGSFLVMLAAVTPRGVFGRVLSWQPLVALGKLSYGVYLIHWPILLFIRQTWPLTSPIVRFVLTTIVSILGSWLLTRFIESPFRARAPGPTIPSQLRGRALGIGAVAVVAAMLIMPMPGSLAPAQPDFDDELARLEEFNRQVQSDLATDNDSTEDTAVEPDPSGVGNEEIVPPEDAPIPIPRLGIVGDSNALKTLMNLDVVGLSEQGIVDFVGGDARLGCGYARFDMRARMGPREPIPEVCLQWPQNIQHHLDSQQPTMVVVIQGVWEWVDVYLPGSTEATWIGRPEADAFIKSEYQAVIDQLRGHGVHVVLAPWPRLSTAQLQNPTEGIRRQADPARAERFHQIMQELATENPTGVEYLDMTPMVAEYLDDPIMREDGSHFADEASRVWVNERLIPELVNIWERAHEPA